MEKFSKSSGTVKRFGILVIAALLVNIAHAESKQAARKHSIALHASPNIYSKTITSIDPNSDITVLGTDMSTGFAYVQTSDKKTGWIRMQHLRKMPASQTLTPSAPPKINRHTKHKFTSWVQQGWRKVRTASAKVSQKTRRMVRKAKPRHHLRVYAQKRSSYHA